MMEIFPLSPETRAFLRRAAFRGAEELGVFRTLADAPGGVTAEELARSLGVAPRRLRALLDVLVLEKAIGQTAARYCLKAVPPPAARLPPQGWGLIAESVRQNRPAAADRQSDGDRRRLHHHLCEAGAAAAQELAAGLAMEGGDLLDAGGGAGAYTTAYLDTVPEARATLVDLPAVIALARPALARYGTRVRFVDGDLAEAEAGCGYRIGLMANLLHLHPPGTCARLVARVSDALAPGGILVIRDFLIDKERREPDVGVLFALNMALYTDGGDVYDADQIASWMAAAGLIEVRQQQLISSPDSLVLTARRPRCG